MACIVSIYTCSELRLGFSSLEQDGTIHMFYVDSNPNTPAARKTELQCYSSHSRVRLSHGQFLIICYSFP